ncbi:MAG: hypothetical protein ABI861_09350 [Panacibacter sp.]
MAWLVGSWRGKSFLPGSDAAQYFLLILRVNSVKGNQFDGTLSTMEPADTSIRYDSKISGEIYSGYLQIERSKIFYVKNSPGSRWQLSCINCKPAKMMFDIQKEKFFIKGATEGCYRECNGISEFSKAINEMKAEDQDSVYALMQMQKPRLNTGTLTDTSTKVLQEDVAVLRKTVLTPPGDLALVKDNKVILASINLLESLKLRKPTMTIKENDVPVEHKISFSVDTIAMVANDKTKITAPEKLAPPPVAVSLLPTGYTQRKVNVVRTIEVNTDSITMRVYDNGVVDGDIVSVVYNDKVVIDKLSLVSKAFVLKIPVTPEAVNTLVFYAHNLGEFPPNTARLEIIYGNKKEELTISSDYTVSSSVNIVYHK